MVTEAKFKIALKEMMKTKRLEEINVTVLCKKCGVHRQTFYYHYQDIYDLIAAIFLNEDLSDAENAKTVKGVLTAFSDYVYENFSFFRSTYNSAARDFTDDFIFGKINATLFSLWSKDKKIGIKKAGIRDAARRYSHIVADEFGYCFKNPRLSPESFKKAMTSFIDLSIATMLPAVMELSKKEEGGVE